MKKYKLTNKMLGKKLYRIRALRDFDNVKKGELGGFIEKEDNLSHEGNCWVYDDARVCDDAQVCDNARVYNNAQVCGNAQVYNNAQVYDNALVYNNARVYGSALVCDDARVCGYARVCDNARVCGLAKITKGLIVSSKDFITIEHYKHSITVQKSGIIQIGCKCWNSLEDFKKTYKQVGKDGGYEDKEIKEGYKWVLGSLKCLKERFK